jgi:long-subunit acyl-CoA synthetase (AMP-forming)
MASHGVRAGDSVAIMMVNRPEFHLVDAAAFHLGATPFSVYNTSSSEQLTFLFEDAGPRLVICEEQFLPVVLAAGTSTVVCLETNAESTLTLEELEHTVTPGFDFEATWRAVRPEDTLTLIYTSGTTGPPKGVELSHANMLAEVASTDTELRIRPGDKIISFLPSAHVADRWAAHYVQAVHGTELTCVPDHKLIGAALVDVRPDLFGAVPQVFSKMRLAIEAAINAEPEPDKRSGIERAIELGRRHVRALQAGDVSADLTAAYQSCENTVFAAMRARIGLDRARVVLSGAAPLPGDLVEFFNAIGVPLSDAWGMSELSGMATIAPTGAHRLGTIGRPVPGTEIRTADDGELLVRGPLVMKGYHNRPDLTAEVIDEQGWLHTGDIGDIDADGFVRILDRKKELIINAAGKNMSPANIENAIKSASPLIGHAVAIGNDRPYNVALIVLAPEAAQSLAATHGLNLTVEELALHPVVDTLLQDAIDTANARLSRVEQIKRFTVLPTTWEPGTDVLTHTMKLRRKPIADRYAREVEELYERVSSPH